MQSKQETENDDIMDPDNSDNDFEKVEVKKLEKHYK